MCCGFHTDYEIMSGLVTVMKHQGTSSWNSGPRDPHMTVVSLKEMFVVENGLR